MNTQLILLCAFFVAGASVTVTKAKITESFRNYIKASSPHLGELFGCPYCLSHWFAFIAACCIMSPYTVWSLTNLVQVIMLTFALVAMAAIITGTMLRLLLWGEMEIKAVNQQLEIAALEKADLQHENGELKRMITEFIDAADPEARA